MSSYLYTLGGYATLFGVGYLIYHVSTQKARERASAASRTRTSRASSQVEGRKESKTARPRTDTAQSDIKEDEPASTSAERPLKVKSNKAKQLTTNVWLGNTDDTSADDAAATAAAAAAENREFARQLASTKEGKKFNSKSSGEGGSRQKSVKQSRAFQVTDFDMEPVVSAPSSMADADDDQSSELSPSILPADSTGVVDMLEKESNGPRILRLTDTDSSVPKKAKSVREPEKVEVTKKQRQNKKKTETAKLAREATEQERKLTLEASRRLARLSEGRPAKDGTEFMAGLKSVQKNSAWAGAGNVSDRSQDANIAPVQLLDTLEDVAKPPTQSSTSTSGRTADASASSEDGAGSWMAALPSEEEQMEMIKDKDEFWNTVKPKSSKKPGRRDGSAVVADDSTASMPIAKPKAVAPTPMSDWALRQNNSYGSFSALSANESSSLEDGEEVEREDDEREEDEREWDV